MVKVNPRICIVERNSLVREYLGLYFEKNGYRVLSCASAREFFLLHENTALESPDLIMLDALLPDLTCPEFLERAHSSAKLAKCKIVLTVDNVSSLQVQAGLRAGALDVVRKPMSAALLTTKIAQWVGPGNAVWIVAFFLAMSSFLFCNLNAQAQDYRIEESAEIGTQHFPQSGEQFQGRALQSSVRYTEKDLFFFELQLRVQNKYNLTEYFYGPRFNLTLSKIAHAECAINFGPGAEVFPNTQYECLTGISFSNGSVFTLLGNISNYKTVTTYMVRPLLEHYWLAFRSAYALFISRLSQKNVMYAHQFIQSWYPNDLNKFEISYAFGHTEGWISRDLTILGEWSFIPTWWLLSSAGIHFLDASKTTLYSLGIRHEF